MSYGNVAQVGGNTSDCHAGLELKMKHNCGQFKMN